MRRILSHRIRPSFPLHFSQVEPNGFQIQLSCLRPTSRGVRRAGGDIRGVPKLCRGIGDSATAADRGADQRNGEAMDGRCKGAGAASTADLHPDADRGAERLGAFRGRIIAGAGVGSGDEGGRGEICAVPDYADQGSTSRRRSAEEDDYADRLQR